MTDKTLTIIGSGVAGLTAAIYAARADNKPHIIHGDERGGQLTLTSEVDNYPGFPEGIGGVELINNMEEQAKQFGATTSSGIVETINGTEPPYEIQLSSGETIATESIILASGSSARSLGIPGEDELMGFGVSTCATCDGAFFRGEDMVVIGGGDAAFEEAHFLTKFADTVHLLHRRENFRAEAHWQNRVQKKVENGEIVIHKNTEATAIHGSAEDGIESVDTVYHPDGHPTEQPENVESSSLNVGAVFVAIGHVPNTGYLEDTQIQLDENGYITVEPTGDKETTTQLEGIFAAGDVVDSRYQQAVTAAGMGSKAAIDVDEYLSN